MDITSPRLLKIKAALFVVITLLCSGLLVFLVYPAISWAVAALFLTCLWATCRAYYFCFYVLQHYADPSFRYAGLLDLTLQLTGLQKKNQKPD
jgi:hypothetical protein